jgi:arylsulfatase A-like enzyme
MKRRLILPSLVALAFAANAGLWLRDALIPRPVNIVFLTVESWRAEAATAARMPNLFSAAEAGTRFTAHHAVSAWTAPNIIAVLTGLSPFAQGVHARGQSIAADRTVFLEELAREGWQIAGLQSFMAIDVFANLGLTVTPRDDLLPWLAARARDRRQFVLWYHYLATHLPYAPADRYRGEFDRSAERLDAEARKRIDTVRTAPAIPAGTVAFAAGDRPAIAALYHGGFAEFDDWFGEFWDFFERSGLRESTVLVVTADHGEELLERGNVGHASTTRAGHLHEEILRIPMFVWLPPHLRDSDPPRIAERPTSHLDIVPELRRRTGLAGGGSSGGLFDGSRSAAPLTAATSYGGYAGRDPEHPSGFEAVIYDGDWKLRLRQDAGAPIQPFLHDLAHDPDERVNLAGKDAARVRAMSADLLPTMNALWQRRAPSDRADRAPETTLARPQWIMPDADGTVRYADIADGVRLQWTGDPAGRYVIEYQAGDGPLAIDGELDVTGTEKDFGDVGEIYWRTWVVPYGRVRLRVMPEGRVDLATTWRELMLQP